MGLMSGGCGSGKRDVRHQSASNAKFDSSLTSGCHSQCGHDGGAGRDRPQEFCAVNALALERLRREHFKPMQTFGQQQNARDDRCARKMTRERGVIDSNAKRRGRLGERSSGGAHLSTAP
jgi:hypothetical protein